ncbi:MAG: gliding motility-associated C-terminal domain-containing protein [Flavobacteriia bacterium]|nr:gliding motility-associated C-terminal domain-containing protein [Flavobacteriia bacterium]
MKFLQILLLQAALFLFCNFLYGQRAKDGSYTATAINSIVNTYTYLTANATSGATSITVNSNSLTGANFASSLNQGDLILIIQMQGATLDVDVTPTASWGGHYTVPLSAGGDWHLLANVWGNVTNYNNAGKYEQVEVLSVAGTNTINLQCGLLNNYTASGHVQIVRVPRFQDVTVNTATSIVPSAWNGQIGGVVTMEIAGNLVINGTGKISASGLGFRGGVADNVGGASSGVSTGAAGPGTGIGDTFLASDQGINGARKGEGIGGYTTEYAALYSTYGRSAAGNGGGGAGYQNAGGGGGSNIGTGAYTGKGVPSTTYNSIWNLELAGFGGSSSSGGGRGGYTLSSSNQDETTVGPNNSLWGTGYRKPEGGLGGHSLTYDNTRLFMGGGGGAGDQDNGQGGSGGAGGGIVFVTVYGAISGTGTLESDGAAGLKSNPLNQTAGLGQRKGNDGAGGAGGGGSVFVKNNGIIPATIIMNAKGGKGGDNTVLLGSGASNIEANGPGGGGAGGAIAFTSGTPTQSVIGGQNGTTSTSGSATVSTIANFPPNGATIGASGMSSLVSTIYDLIPHNDTVCMGHTASLSVSLTGTMPAGGVIYWYTQQFGGVSIASGATFTTPILNATTTYYAGICPGTFRIPVIAVVRPNPVITGTAIITNAGCTVLGSITGLTVSGGTAPYTYAWNTVSTSTANLTNAAIGTYNLLVTDSKGCTDTDGPYSITGTSAPTLNTTNIVITNQNCNGVNGSISGITVSGGTTPYSYSWSNGGGTNLNALNLIPGSYVLTVTDNAGCVVNSGSYTINSTTGPTINTAGMTIQNASCGSSNGSISGITVSGTGLSYNWNNGLASTLNLVNQAPGNYSLVVTDGNGCTANAGPFTINSTGSIAVNSASAIVTNDHCNQGGGAISGLTISGGTNPINYTWTNSTQTSLNITNLVAGTYTLTATDVNGCVATSTPFTVNNIAGPSIDVTGITIVNATCDLINGSISGITASGTSLTYSWSNGAGSSLNASNLNAGSYVLTVTDNFGCSVSTLAYSVTNTQSVTINTTGVVIQNASCGSANGSITGISVSGTGLSYNWNNGLATTLDLLNQLPGTFSLVVTSSNGCSANAGPFTINSAGSIAVNSASVNVTNDHCNQGNGAISGVIISGGTNPINYTWTNSTQTSLNITNLVAGTYTLTVTDLNGCTATSSPFTVNNIAGPSMDQNSVVIVNETCTNSNGSISGIAVTGSNLTYLWDNGAGTNVNSSNLSAGTYVLTVTDNFGCSVISNPFTLIDSPSPTIDLTGIIIQNATCGTANGSITGITANGTGLVYNWNNGLANTIDLLNQNVGNYSLVVTDGNGCVANAGPFTINSTGTLAINSTPAIVIDEHCNQADGSISGILISGGSTPYSYAWSNTTQTTLDITALTAGTYGLTVTDASGCQAVSNLFTVVNTVAPIIDQANMLVNNESCTSNDGSISGITVTGSNLVYSWSNNAGNAINASNLTAGNYILTVTDQFGCVSISNPIAINGNVPMGIDATNVIIVPKDCDQNNGAINGVMINGGINPQFSWSNGMNTLDINSLMAGNYVLTVVDDQGCIQTYNATIINKLPPVIDVSSMSISSVHCDENDGKVSGISVSGGTPDYVINWNGLNTNNSLDLVNIPAGIYNLEVVDNAGCTDSKQITVDNIPGPEIDLTSMVKNEISCTELGSISGVSINGNAPFTYLWSNNETTLDVNNLVDGAYTLNVIDAFGCATTSSPFTFVPVDKPVANFYWTPVHPGIGESFDLLNISSGATSYNWTFGDGTMSNLFAPTHIYTNDTIQSYEIVLVAKSAEGCVDSIKYTIILNEELIFYIPNSFTPNNDQYNNVFQPIFTQGYDNYDFSMLIFNRWGETIFESNDPAMGWDGTYNGLIQQDGTYTWRISFKMSQTDEKKLVVGNVNLLK